MDVSHRSIRPTTKYLQDIQNIHFDRKCKRRVLGKLAFIAPHVCNYGRLISQIEDCNSEGAWREILKKIEVKTIVPLSNHPTYLYTDYSADGGMGAVLKQDGCLIGMMSKKPTERTQAYGAYKGEAWAITEALKKFKKQIPVGSRIHTDQKALTYLSSSTYTIPRFFELAEDISRHGWLLKTIKGVNNFEADALSRLNDLY